MQAAPARAEATVTDPGGEVGLLAVLDDDRHGGSEWNLLLRITH